MSCKDLSKLNEKNLDRDICVSICPDIICTTKPEECNMTSGGWELRGGMER